MFFHVGVGFSIRKQHPGISARSVSVYDMYDLHKVMVVVSKLLSQELRAPIKVTISVPSLSRGDLALHYQHVGP